MERKTKCMKCENPITQEEFEDNNDLCNACEFNLHMSFFIMEYVGGVSNLYASHRPRPITPD